MRRSPLPILLAVGLALSACGGGGKNQANGKTKSSTSSTAPDKVQGQVASYDLAAGPPTRFILGLFNEARGPVGYGTVPFSFYFLGENSAGTAQPGPTATASYLPLPGSPPPPADTSKPVYLPTDQRGVYAADVTFDRPGYWGVSVTVNLNGPQKIDTAFKVLAKHAVPFVGDPAIPSQNLTMTTPGAPPEAIDSRASANTPVPDAELHQTTVAQALSEHRPVVLVISTPTYCVSLFCGPVTDMVQSLAKDYANRARFIHIEVWKDYKGQQLNDAAKEWIARTPDQDINEPWVFIIGADGKISARFDNVVTRNELEPLIQKLPVMKS